MSSKTVQFKIEIPNIEIQSFDFQVLGLVRPYNGVAALGWDMSGNTFSGTTAEGMSDYFSVMVLIKKYAIGSNTYTPDRPLNMLATFRLSTADYVVKITPESTIASIYTFARMATVKDDGYITIVGEERNMKIAYGMKENFYRTEGFVDDMIKTSPNGFETNSYPMFNSLCNIFYYCLTNPESNTGKPFYDQFLEYVWHEADKPNTNFLGAILNLLYNPCWNATEIYDMLAGTEEIYKDSLTTMKNVTEKAPNNWTLTLKSNLSGSKNFIPSGTAFVVFDADDNAWVANNFRAGSGLSGTHCLVYQYNARPASFSPVQGGGLLGVGFGVAIDPSKEYISFGNFGWGPILNNPQEGSISRFYKDGTPITPSNGFISGLSRVQGMNYDNSGNLWIASVGCQDPFAPAPPGVYPFKSAPSAVVMYPAGDPVKEPKLEDILILDEFPVKKSYDSAPENIRTPYLKIFDVVPDNKGNVYVSCIGHYDKNNIDNCALSAVYKVAIDGKQPKVIKSWYSDHESKTNGQTGYESLRQLAINGEGDVVVVGVTGSRATILDGEELTFKGYYDVNTYGPWGVKIDGKQNVFLANFGHDTDYVENKHPDEQGPFGVTMLRDPSDKNSAVLLTVPTGGEEVMLANGMPLYGTQTKPGEPVVLIQGEPTFTKVRMKCYQPIMRLTSTNIDGAGNLWCMNNWKPSAIVDVKDNPGGDGVVIFLGIAEPE